jgi:hypothetical protein
MNRAVDLPSALIAITISFLSQLDYCTLVRVCTAWRRGARASAAVPVSISITRGRDIGEDPPLPLILVATRPYAIHAFPCRRNLLVGITVMTHLRVLRLRFPTHNHNAQVSMLAPLVSLQYLCVHAHDIVILAPLPHFPDLKTLKLTWRRGQRGDAKSSQSLIHTIYSTSTLETLHVPELTWAHGTILQLGRACPRLRHLYTEVCPYELWLSISDSAAPVDTGPAFPSLETFCGWTRTGALRHMPALTSVEIRTLTHTDTNELTQGLSRPLALRHLLLPSTNLMHNLNGLRAICASAAAKTLETLHVTALIDPHRPLYTLDVLSSCRVLHTLVFDGHNLSHLTSWPTLPCLRVLSLLRCKPVDRMLLCLDHAFPQLNLLALTSRTAIQSVVRGINHLDTLVYEASELECDELRAHLGTSKVRVQRREL